MTEKKSWIYLLLKRSCNNFPFCIGYRNNIKKTPVNNDTLQHRNGVQRNKFHQSLRNVWNCFNFNTTSYCSAIKKYSGCQRFWIFDNSATVVKMIDECNVRPVQNIKTYDFSTLYTSIPHAQHKECPRWSIDKAFKGSGQILTCMNLLRGGRNNKKMKRVKLFRWIRTS